MATYDDPYNPIPRRLREPTPGYSPARLPGTERTVVETPRGGFSPDPAAGLSERDLTPENYAMPFSPTRSMRYGPGDERDLGAPVVDPRSPLAPSPATWSGVVPRGSGRAAFDGRGGYAYTDAPAVPDQTTPRPLFADAPGEDFEATRRRGEQVARLMREQDGPFANPNDWNYVRSYGPRAAAQAVASGRANISGAPAELVAQERERFLRNRTTDLSISPQLRSAARDELAQIERDAAEERRREMWAAEQAARLRMAEGANAATVEAARLTAQGQEAAAKAKAEAEAAAAAAAANAAAAKPVPMDAETPGMFVGGNWVENPAYNPKPVTGGGNSVSTWNKETKTWDTKFPPKDGKPAQIIPLKPGETAYNPDTGDAFVAPGVDVASVQQEIANLTDALAKASSKTAPLIEKQLKDARARLAKLVQGGQAAAPAAPAQPASGGASSPSEPPAPAPEPATAPAAVQEPKPAPPGFRRLDNGELEYVG